MEANEIVKNDMATRRLLRELRDITKNPTSLIKAETEDGNLFKWTATIKGPPGTPYEEGEFILSLTFPSSYPLDPPNVVFITKVYHANIDSKGRICLDILDLEWSPAITVEKLLLSILSLLSDCNPSSPLSASIARLYEKDRRKHDENARNFTRKYAKPKHVLR